ncbi:MAG: phosphatidylserine/phosphatidylglycerophosphate/cardiolipin synthase family protein [Bacteroidales bacterium]|nr:phosphatidylserine/phosphatidylglycerophosphate/cardiolipin synthase family protein [Bacteroidales bacterium]
MEQIREPYHLFHDPIRYYFSMLEDIRNAKKSIYIETYRMGNDSIGVKFKDILTKKCKEGLDIKILIDSWGAGSVNHTFFSELIKNGGKIRFFEKIKFNFDFFTKGHKRNHRKLLIIDNDISYIGSSNLTEYNLNWRELMLRMKCDIASTFIKIINQDYRMYKKYVFDKKRYSQVLKHDGFKIVRDVPSITIQRTKKEYLELIKNAKSKVVIETPYFLPGFMLRKALMDAAKRGIDVKIIIPRHSDVNLIDVLRNNYLGILHKSGINILYYLPHNLHAKLLMIDDEIFSIGSINFDYRSFRYMYEISLIGDNKEIVEQLKKHVTETIAESEKFDYEFWKRRPLISRFFEWLLLPIRHLL